MATTFGGTATAGGAQTITLSATSPPGTNNLIQGQNITITSGTGAGQCRQCYLYISSTRVATVFPAWNVTPDSTSVYTIESAVFPVGVIRVAQAAGGSASSITLDAGASTLVGGTLLGGMILIVAGTGVGQVATYQSYVPGTQVMTIASGSQWFTNPDSTSVFCLMASNGGPAANSIGGSTFASGAISASNFAASAISAAAIASGAITNAKFGPNAISSSTFDATTLPQFNNSTYLTYSSATSTTIVATTNPSSIVDFFKGWQIIAGTGKQVRTIIGSNGATFTIDRAWSTTPSSGTFVLVPGSTALQYAGDQSTTAAAVLSQATPTVVAGSVGEALLPPASTVSTGTNGATTFSTALGAPAVNAYKNQWLCFLSGYLAGQSQQIASNDASGNITMATAFTTAPSSTDRFILIGK